MNDLMILLSQVFILSWLITRFSPLQMILELLPDKLILNMIQLLFSCSKCFAFWFSLIYTGDIFLSAFMSFIMMIYEKTIGFWENRVRLK